MLARHSQEPAPRGLPIAGRALPRSHATERSEQQIGDIEIDFAPGARADGKDTRPSARP